MSFFTASALTFKDWLLSPVGCTPFEKRCVRILQESAVQHATQRAANLDPADNVLARHTGKELLDRLSLLTLTPRIILDLGCGAGVEADLLTQYYPGAVVVGLDACAAPLFKGRPLPILFGNDGRCRPPAVPGWGF